VTQIVTRDDREKQFIALASVVAAAGLAGTKLCVGLVTDSLGILSEAAHSGLDLVAAATAWCAIRVSSRPADLEHPYGHGKVENLSALFQVLLLLGTCVWIAAEAIERLVQNRTGVEPSVWAFGVMAGSIVVDVVLARKLYRVARKHNSQSLEAGALHFSSDIWSSGVVLIGLALAWIGDRAGLFWLLHADAVAALSVSVIAVWLSCRLGRKTVADLLDEVPPGINDKILKAMYLPGVRRVSRVRVRRSGPKIFIDAVLCMEAGASLSQSHALADAIEQEVRQILPGADVILHIEPNGGPRTQG